MKGWGKPKANQFDLSLRGLFRYQQHNTKDFNSSI